MILLAAYFDNIPAVFAVESRLVHVCDFFLEYSRKVVTDAIYNLVLMRL